MKDKNKDRTKNLLLREPSEADIAFWRKKEPWKFLPPSEENSRKPSQKMTDRFNVDEED